MTTATKKGLETEYLEKIAKLEALLAERNTQPQFEVKQDDYIEVISLCPMPLNLSTQGKGQGVIYRFTKFGEKKRIVYSHLSMIIENCRSFAEKGYFYILNPKVVQFNGLDEHYNTLLNRETIVSILDGNSESAIELFKVAKKPQQDLIVSMLIARVRDGEFIDLNILDKISRISGVNIQKEADEANQFTKSLERE